jgi:hypothetical protein
MKELITVLVDGEDAVITTTVDTNKTVSNILLSSLTPYSEGVTVDRQCGFRNNRSPLIRFPASSHTEVNMGVKRDEHLHQEHPIPLVGSTVQYSHWVWRIHETVVANSLTHSEETYREVSTGKYFLIVSIQNGLTLRDAFSPLLFKVRLWNKVLISQETRSGGCAGVGGSKWIAQNHQCWWYFFTGRKCLYNCCRHRNAAQNHNIQMANKLFENVEPKYLEQTLTNLNRSHEEMKTLNWGKVFTGVPCILMPSKSFIYQLMHNRVALKEY